SSPVLISPTYPELRARMPFKRSTASLWLIPARRYALISLRYCGFPLPFLNGPHSLSSFSTSANVTVSETFTSAVPVPDGPAAASDLDADFPALVLRHARRYC